MYEKLMKKAMSEDVTLEDWIEFRTFMENIPAEDLKQMSSDFAKAARYVVSKLSEEDISQDMVLVLAYEEIHHPELFS